MAKLIIGLTGKAGVGKTTAEKFILKSNNDIHSTSFAKPLKNMLKALGLNDDQLEDQKSKSEIIEHLKSTPRKLMQTLGTEWGRMLIDNDIWVNILEEEIEHIKSDILITDVRFENEADFVRHNGNLIHIIDLFDEENSSHSSENGVEKMGGDYFILKNDSLEEFERQILFIIDEIRG